MLHYPVYCCCLVVVDFKCKGNWLYLLINMLTGRVRRCAVVVLQCNARRGCVIFITVEKMQHIHELSHLHRANIMQQIKRNLDILLDKLGHDKLTTNLFIDLCVN